MSTPKIQFARVSCAFVLQGQEFRAVNDLDLDIADGEIVTLVGPSGCGKSTLMNMRRACRNPPAARCASTASPSPAPGPNAA
jgi:NitT/TauT family transport system ATP-binding protein